MSRYALCALVGMLAASAASGQESPKTQGLLGPGLYVFQTRTRASSCGDSEKDGYVMSFMAAVDGIPGSTAMTMQLINNPHFNKWALKVADEGTLSGTSKMGTTPTSPETHFTAKLDGDRWKGAGARTYQGVLNGKPARCQVDYDALLRRIDTRMQE